MLKHKLINLIKTCSVIYDIYYYFGSIILKFIGMFIKNNEKVILFVSFGGNKYDDSPKALYEYICNEKYFDDYKLIWAFNEPDKYAVGRAQKIKIDTIRYFLVALSSKYWISNSAVERGLNFKKKKTYYINTWHGTPLKKIGTDACSTSSKTGLGSKNIYTQNIMTAQSSFDAEIFSRVFNIDRNNLLICDLPRNDFLMNYNKNMIAQIKDKLGIHKDKKVILYAPTYREYIRDESNSCYLAPPISCDKWKDKLGNDYVVLFRIHYEVEKVMQLDNVMFINVSDYENLNELMIISDMLVSDYSSIFFDYSILEKPMLCFAYDLDEYSRKRGLYLDLKAELPCDIAFDEDILLEQIVGMNYEDAVIKTRRFKYKYVYNAGNACKTIVNELVRRSMSSKQ